MSENPLAFKTQKSCSSSCEMIAEMEKVKNRKRIENTQSDTEENWILFRVDAFTKRLQASP